VRESRGRRRTTRAGDRSSRPRRRASRRAGGFPPRRPRTARRARRRRQPQLQPRRGTRSSKSGARFTRPGGAGARAR
jgi:hypothetical protein